MQLLLTDVLAGLHKLWNSPTEVHRHNPLVASRDNYDRLGYGPDAAARDSRYSRPVSPTVMLRSHTSAGVPALLDSLRGETGRCDVPHVLPGLVYRRDSVDRTHVGTPHQLDLWRLRARGMIGLTDLHQLIAAVVAAVLPGAQWRAVPTTHPYTAHGHQLNVMVQGEWGLNWPNAAWSQRPFSGPPGWTRGAGPGWPRGWGRTARSCCRRASRISGCCARRIRACRASCRICCPGAPFR